MMSRRKAEIGVALLALAGVIGASAACHRAAGSGQTSPVDGGGDSDTDADADTDTGSDTDSGPEELPLACPGLAEGFCESGYPEPYEQITTSADYGTGVSLVAVSGSRATLLAERDGDDGFEPLIFVADHFGDDPSELEIGLADPPQEPLRARDLVADYLSYDAEWGLNWNNDGVLGYGAIALLCADSGCTLFGPVEAEDPPAVLVPVPEGSVPLVDTRGLIGIPGYPSWDPIERVCAFGDGIACFDGEAWSTVLADDTGPPLRAATSYSVYDDELLIAAGDQGRLVVETADGYAAIETGTSASLLSVAGTPKLLAAGTDDGALVLMDEDELLLCPVADEPIVKVRVDRFVNMEELHREVTAYTQSGRVLEISDGGAQICELAEQLGGEPLDVTEWAPATDSFNTLVITQDTIFDRTEGGWYE